MKEHLRTQGIVLKKNDRGENDRVFTVFTKDFGKLDLWAIGERKIASKLRSGLELLYVSEFEFVQGKNKKTLIDTLLLENYQAVRRDLTRLRVALRMAETLNMFLKGQMQDSKVWNLLQDSLATLADKDFPLERCAFVYYYFFWNLVSHLGWKPRHALYGNEVSGMLSLFLRGDPALLLDHRIEKFSTKALYAISRRYFLEIQKEVH